MAKKITYARLHSIPHVPFAGELEQVFPGHRKTLDDLDMSFDGISLDISFTFKGKPILLVIPAANVQCMLSTAEVPKPASKK